LRGQDGKSSPAWPGSPLPPPVKETPSTTQSAFRLVIFPRAFAREPSLCVSSVKMSRKTRAPISPSPHRGTRQRCYGFLPARSRPRRTQSFDRVSSLRPNRMRAVGRCTVCLAATRGSRRRMRLTDFCFPTTSTTSTRVSSIPVMVTGLSPDASAGDRAFHDATICFGGLFVLGWRTFSFLPPADEPNLWHPCRLPSSCPCCFRPHEPLRGRRDRFRRPP